MVLKLTILIRYLHTAMPLVHDHAPGRGDFMFEFPKGTMPIVAGVALLILGSTTVSWGVPGMPVPEIDPSSGMSALALIAGAVLIIRARRKN